MDHTSWAHSSYYIPDLFSFLDEPLSYQDCCRALYSKVIHSCKKEYDSFFRFFSE